MPIDANGDAILAATEPLLSGAQMQTSDEHTIENLGVPGIVLMEHAGRAVADVVASLRRAPSVTSGSNKRHRNVAGKVVVVCGPGNNGGDGYVAARHLACHGFDVDVFALKAPGALNGDAKTAGIAWERFREQNNDQALATWVAPSPDDDSVASTSETSVFLDCLAAEMSQATGVVDALFGIGLTRPLKGVAAKVVETINVAACPVVAVDIPSGLPSDGAAPTGPVVQAQRTVTFFEKKIAHVCEPGFSACGSIRVVDVTIRSAPTLSCTVRGLRPGASVGAAIGVNRNGRSKTSKMVHKGDFGHVGVVGGSEGTEGAARLAARAALRAGTGLSTLLERSSALPHPSDMVEVMHRSFDLNTAADVVTGLSALVVGPGLGRSEEALERGIAILKARGTRPAVVDADLFAGLFGTKESSSALDGVLGAGAGTLVLTPHPKEAASIIGETTAADVQADRMAAATALVDKCPQAVWVLKGAVPIVAFEDWRVLIPGANPVLAVAGSGDVLAGVIAAHLAMNEATKSGAVIAAIEGCRRHQQAGASFRNRGVLASEIADAIATTAAGAFA